MTFDFNLFTKPSMLFSLKAPIPFTTVCQVILIIPLPRWEGIKGRVNISLSTQSNMRANEVRGVCSEEKGCTGRKYI
jgi:hypothetical protein